MFPDERKMKKGIKGDDIVEDIVDDIGEVIEKELYAGERAYFEYLRFCNEIGEEPSSISIRDEEKYNENYGYWLYDLAASLLHCRHASINLPAEKLDPISIDMSGLNWDGCGNWLIGGNLKSDGFVHGICMLCYENDGSIEEEIVQDDYYYSYVCAKCGNKVTVEK